MHKYTLILILLVLSSCAHTNPHDIKDYFHIVWIEHADSAVSQGSGGEITISNPTEIYYLGRVYLHQNLSISSDFLITPKTKEYALASEEDLSQMTKNGFDGRLSPAGEKKEKIH